MTMITKTISSISISTKAIMIPARAPTTTNITRYRQCLILNLEGGQNILFGVGAIVPSHGKRGSANL